MGFECDFRIKTDLSSEEIYHILRSNLPFVTRWTDADEISSPVIFTNNDGVQIRLFGVYGGEVIEESFGFRPTVTVSFELARGDHPGIDDGMDNMRRGVDWLINNIEGDAVFLANGDRPVLLRRDGQIWLDTKSGFWRERDIPLLTFPYEWKELPRL